MERFGKYFNRSRLEIFQIFQDIERWRKDFERSVVINDGRRKSELIIQLEPLSGRCTGDEDCVNGK